VGEGALKKQLELTKKKLEQEGLFASERKRALPPYPERIGVITSEDAAAFTDVKRVLQNRWPVAELFIVPSAVQGAGSITSLIRAFEIMERQVKPDVIILARGGGSLEDLQAFNSEDLARRMYACTIPTVCGVGHERDVTIADLVADMRASTPSNAVELATPDRQDMLFRIEALADSQTEAVLRMMETFRHAMLNGVSIMTSRISAYVQQCRGFFVSIAHAGSRLAETVKAKSLAVNNESDALQLMLASLMRGARERLMLISHLLASLSPKGILKRGYSITKRADGSLVRSRSEVSKRDILITTVSDGDITSEVSSYGNE
jgi:exodeoxyribonuclease VII large subunit